MQQAITWTNADTDLSRHIMSLGHNDFLKTICTDVFAYWNTR